MIQLWWNTVICFFKEENGKENILQIRYECHFYARPRLRCTFWIPVGFPKYSKTHSFKCVFVKTLIHPDNCSPRS